jgi:predicted nucleotide-binding protein (sugar kinase/HSP70/actin superfamily)
MKAATVHQLKKELEFLDAKTLVKLCLRLARFKKENKELLTYLLFEAQDEGSYVAMVEEEIDELLKDANRSSFYLTKKSVRKALRQTDKYIRYSDEKETEVRLRLYFLTKLKTSEIKIGKSKVLTNMYLGQIKKVKTALEKLHEDLQYDYQQQLEKL